VVRPDRSYSPERNMTQQKNKNVKKRHNISSPDEIDFELDKRWHLARNEREVAVAEFEYSLLRSHEAFSRWQSECLAAVTGLSMNGADNAILHVIRMNDRPKGVKEIGRLINRDDVANIHYSIKKLLKAGLIQKNSAETPRHGVSYEATDEGITVTEKYAQLRSKLLVQIIQNAKGVEENLVDATRLIELMAGIYEQAALVAATYRQKQDS